MAVTELSTGSEPVPEENSGWLHNKINRTSALLQFLYVQRISGFSVSQVPEFEPACVPFFLQKLAAAGSYLEFGSGGSTMLAAQSGKPFVVVESDPYFLAAVEHALIDLGRYDQRTQTFIHADIGLTEGWGAPVMHRVSADRVARWRRYPEAPWAKLAKLPGPHLILVDGRFRAACALMAAKFLHGRDGQVLIDDYVERGHYSDVERYLEPVEQCGRMVLFKRRADVDAAALDADCEHFFADYR